MSQLRIQLDQLLKNIGVAHLVPSDSCDKNLHSWVCKLMRVDKVSDTSFEHLNEMSASLDCVVTVEDKKQIYNIISTYEKSIA